MTDIAMYSRHFFDRQVVKDRLGPAKARAMLRTGAYTRTVAQNSMKPVKGLVRPQPQSASPQRKKRRRRRRLLGRKKSRPFKSRVDLSRAPRYRTRVLKDLIFFGYDTSAEVGVVGPIPAATNTADTLEFGGTVFLPGPDGEMTLMNYSPHPYMGPALEKSQERFPHEFRNILST